jgi:hypothetical protein
MWEGGRCNGQHYIFCHKTTTATHIKVEKVGISSNARLSPEMNERMDDWIIFWLREVKSNNCSRIELVCRQWYSGCQSHHIVIKKKIVGVVEGRTLCFTGASHTLHKKNMLICEWEILRRVWSVMSPQVFWLFISTRGCTPEFLCLSKRSVRHTHTLTSLARYLLLMGDLNRSQSRPHRSNWKVSAQDRPSWTFVLALKVKCRPNPCSGA